MYSMALVLSVYRKSLIFVFCNDEMKDVDEAYWINLDRLLTEHIGINFTNEDYDEREARAKELKRKRK